MSVVAGYSWSSEFTLHKKKFSIALLASLVVILIKAGGFPVVENTLWAEDGNVFLNQAAAEGWESLFKTYAGYIHLWPRIFSIISTLFDSSYSPYIMFSGWTLAYLCMSWSLVSRLHECGVNLFFCCLCVFFIGLLPVASETFFTVTNAQWYLAVALSVFVLLEGGRKSYFSDYLLLATLSLTGPFSIILTPVVAIKIAIRKLKVDLVFYGVFFLCAAIQLYFLLGSGRVASGDIDVNVLHWLDALKTFLMFGGTGGTAAILFWVIYCAGFIYVLRTVPANKYLQLSFSVALGLAALLFYISALWSIKQSPHILSPIGGGSRYFVPVYGLIFISCVLLFDGYFKLLSLVSLVILAICASGFTVFQRQDLQFSAFSALSEVEDGVVIPISPHSGDYTAWHVAGWRSGGHSSRSYGYKLSDVVARGAVNTSEGRFAFGDDPQFLLSEKISCNGYEHVGVRFTVSRLMSGWMQIFWNEKSQYSEAESLSRYYSSGEVKAFFAFKNHPNGLYVRFDPSDKADVVELKDVKVYCLEAMN